MLNKLFKFIKDKFNSEHKNCASSQTKNNSDHYEYNHLPEKFSEPLFGNIPQDIVNLLWFKNGPHANYKPEVSEINIGNSGIYMHISGADEPSLIDIELPIESYLSHIELNEDIGYFPSYTRLLPHQRYIYLRWLSDITQPIPIGYVFIFYYGLERHLLKGNVDKAAETIAILRKHHTNHSFLSYSIDALISAVIIYNRSELLKYADLDNGSPHLLMLLQACLYHELLPDVLVKHHRLFGFTNNRYIKNEPVLFNQLFHQNLNKKYGKPSCPVSRNDFKSVKTTFPLIIANYSLSPNERMITLPDVTSINTIHSSIHNILVETHEAVKSSLKSRKKANNINEDNAVMLPFSGNYKDIAKNDYAIFIPPFNSNCGDIAKNNDDTVILSFGDNHEDVTKDMPIYEVEFFTALKSLAKQAGFRGVFEIHQLGDKTYNVSFDDSDLFGGYLGKIRLRQSKTKFAVKKDGATRATKIFNNKEDAEQFAILKGSLYKIEERTEPYETFLQYIRHIDDEARYVRNASLEKYIASISYWFKYIKRERKEAAKLFK